MKLVKLRRKFRRLKGRLEPAVGWERVRFGIRTFLVRHWLSVLAQIATMAAFTFLVWWSLHVATSIWVAALASFLAAGAVFAVFLPHNIGRVKYYMNRAVRSFIR